MVWASTEVRLISPSPQQCTSVVSKLIDELPNVQHDEIYLHSSSADSTLLLLSQLHQIGTRRLYIDNTPLNDEHIYCLTHCLQVYNKLEVLSLNKCIITDNVVKSLSNSLLHNNTLTVLYLNNNPQISSDGIQHLLHLLYNNKTIKRLAIDSKHRSSTEQHKNYQQIKHRLGLLRVTTKSTSLALKI